MLTPPVLLCHPSFNPRVLAGGRDMIGETDTNVKAVSIHASSREDATSGNRGGRKSFQFQSTRPRGRTRLTS